NKLVHGVDSVREKCSEIPFTLTTYPTSFFFTPHGLREKPAL
ncbi:MAG: hypothetical protein JWP89_4934, partial [Schlesneria sp.]|nr:hypothetical protein [Schlesneria sp.]